MEKKLMDTATKIEINAAKTDSKQLVKKNYKRTEDLIGNKIADKTTSLGKSKNKEKDEANEVKEIYIPQEKRQQVIDYLRLL